MTTPSKELLSGICVLVDGGCLNNNKAASERKMYGSMTVLKDGKQIESHYGNKAAVVHKQEILPFEGHASNNIAEVVMLGNALGYCKELIGRMKNKGMEIPQIMILSDSEFAIMALTGEYRVKAKNAELQHAVAEAKALYDDMEDVGFDHVDNVWVKSVLGH